MITKERIVRSINRVRELGYRITDGIWVHNQSCCALGACFVAEGIDPERYDKENAIKCASEIFDTHYDVIDRFVEGFDDDSYRGGTDPEEIAAFNLGVEMRVFAGLPTTTMDAQSWLDEAADDY